MAHLGSSQPLMRIHVEHLGDDVLMRNAHTDSCIAVCFVMRQRGFWLKKNSL